MMIIVPELLGLYLNTGDLRTNGQIRVTWGFPISEQNRFLFCLSAHAHYEFCLEKRHQASTWPQCGILYQGCTPPYNWKIFSKDDQESPVTGLQETLASGSITLIFAWFSCDLFPIFMCSFLVRLSAIRPRIYPIKNNYFFRLLP